jgi:hypothetical protein
MIQKIAPKVLQKFVNIIPFPDSLRNSRIILLISNIRLFKIKIGYFS